MMEKMMAMRNESKPSTKSSPTISQIMHKAIAECVFPGGTAAFGMCTTPCYYQAYGTYTFDSTVKVTADSIWDMASLTKIIVTAPCIMVLYERGKIGLDDVACRYLPKFGNSGKQHITVRYLLTHTAGLREFYPFLDMGLTKRGEVLPQAPLIMLLGDPRTIIQVVDYVMKDRIWYGTMTRYSDLSMIVLGLIIEQISGLPLDVFAHQEIFEPLGMQHTSFRPIESAQFNPAVVPTEIDRKHRHRMLWGEVHEPTAFVLGGVAGHAGLFSTIVDVCRFAQAMLAGGLDQASGRRLFKESTVRLFTTPSAWVSKSHPPFALGWDVAVRRAKDGKSSAGKYLGPRTFGHTGFTGTSLWIDPDRNMFVALLTNAVHPTATGGPISKVGEVRPKIADAAVETMEQQLLQRESLTWHLGSITDKDKQHLALRLLQQLENLSEFLTGPNPSAKLEDCVIQDVQVHGWTASGMKDSRDGIASQGKVKKKISFENQEIEKEVKKATKSLQKDMNAPVLNHTKASQTKPHIKRKIHLVFEPPHGNPSVEVPETRPVDMPKGERRAGSTSSTQHDEVVQTNTEVVPNVETPKLRTKNEGWMSDHIEMLEVYIHIRDLKENVGKFTKHMGAFNKKMDDFKSDMEECKVKWYSERTRQWEHLNKDVGDFNKQWKVLNKDVKTRLYYLEKDIKTTDRKPTSDYLRDDTVMSTTKGFEEDFYKNVLESEVRKGNCEDGITSPMAWSLSPDTLLEPGDVRGFNPDLPRKQVGKIVRRVSQYESNDFDALRGSNSEAPVSFQNEYDNFEETRRPNDNKSRLGLSPRRRGKVLTSPVLSVSSSWEDDDMELDLHDF